MGAIRGEQKLSRKSLMLMLRAWESAARMCDVCGHWPAPWIGPHKGRLCSLCYPVVTGRSVN